MCPASPKSIDSTASNLNSEKEEITQENTSELPASVSGSIAEETPAPTDTEAPAEEPAEEPSEEPAESETPTTEDSSSVLIAYFSWSGNMEQVAQIIQQETGGDLFEIAPATAYTDDYNELLDIAQQEQSDNARPELAGQVAFNTSASGGFGRSLSGLEESASGATILEGISFTEHTLGDAQSEVTAWLDGLGL